MPNKLLIVEDNEEIRRQLRWGFSGDDCEVFQAATADEALAVRAREKPQVVTLDLGLPPDAEGCSEGLRCLRELLVADEKIKVIVVTGHHDNDNALRCIQSGAYDFCSKPVDLEELKVIVRRAFFLSGLGPAKQQKSKADPHMHGMVTQCESMQSVLANLPRIAASDAPVLITGESGTGKELAARAIHNLSARSGGPLVTINCGAIPENLLESEFFGHEKGAFTGAAQRVLGKTEYADKGTLFLDEIGELPLNMQVKLLRFLQEMSIQRVGGRQDIKINTRVVAATNINMQQAIADGRFRSDLYYRIGVVNVALPPLRERGEDILLLAEHFIRKFNENGKIKGLHPDTERVMRLYSWPGNVRELENRIRRAIIFTTGPLIKLDAMELGERPLHEASPTGAKITLQEARNEVERKLVLEALNRHSGNIMHAAQSIGVSRPTFYDLLKKHGVDINNKREAPIANVKS